MWKIYFGQTKQHIQDRFRHYEDIQGKNITNPLFLKVPSISGNNIKFIKFLDKKSIKKRKEILININNILVLENDKFFF